MQIATWNINSIRQRTEHLLRYLDEVAPDIVCLQELKCTDDAFPFAAIEAKGYHAAVHGQKGFNGVAILSKQPIEVKCGLPGDSTDEHARYVEGVIDSEIGRLRIVSLYLPNGNPPDTDKYTYKLAWMDRLIAHASTLLQCEELLVLAGDYNVIPMPGDCYDPAVWATDALFLPPTRARFRSLLNLGFTNALRAVSDEPGLYTFWDYQAGAWQRNKGICIDHLLLSPQAVDHLQHVVIDKERRGEDKPSDHVPVRVTLA
ncbi:exodeoxyribonuclease III [Beijerinckia indica]|uniref:Exodeoxyribonuclease III n=1 Tax=Beijerinckia indica subsp. indica (strain ATCC 9039 / DSM 1715 / NCIMB 8712) TaxID=395963 RepID=B2IKA7_BEII9|nr:exodeoxyribonuclease III [Beijerinckia indica]ACB95042.1 exodeoxyribonuclease III [Beijerinckia indica subsp. indica ATCC 9039]